MRFIFQKGAADKRVYLRAWARDTNAPKTDLVYNTSGLSASYTRDGAAATAITLATLASASAAHSDGGFIVVTGHVYRLDLPDAAIATGVDKVEINLVCTDVVFEPCGADLVDYDPHAAPSTTAQIATAVMQATLDTSIASSLGERIGRIPNVAAAANGGLPTVDASNGVKLSVGSGTGQVDLTSGRIKSDVTYFGGAAGTFSSGRPEVNTSHVGGTLQTAGDTVALLNTIATYIDTEVAAIYSRLGAPAGASMSADIAAVKSDTATLLGADVAYKKNVAVTAFVFAMQLTDGTPGTGLTVTATISKDGGAFAAIAGAITEISGGWYKVDIAQAEMNADEIALKFTATGAKQLNIKIRTQS